MDLEGCREAGGLVSLGRHSDVFTDVARTGDRTTCNAEGGILYAQPNGFPPLAVEAYLAPSVEPD